MRMLSCSVLALSLLGPAGCGDDVTPLPLIVANPAYGLVTELASGTVVIVLGSDPIGCGSLDSASPPEGVIVQVQVPEAKVGVPAKHFVMFQVFSGGNGSGGGSGAGSVELTKVTETSIALKVDYAATISGKSYQLKGDFEAERCP
jgi:hypothetical protein